MRVRVAFKKSKRVHERDMWIITIYDTPADIIAYDKRAKSAMQNKIFTKKAKNKELIGTVPNLDGRIVAAINTANKAKDKGRIVREILEVRELTHSNLTIDEHKRQNNKEMS